MDSTFRSRASAYSSQVSFQKYLRDGVSQQIGIAATWDASGIGMHAGDTGYILQHVSEQLDRFILEYLSLRAILPSALPGAPYVREVSRHRRVIR